MTERKGFSLMQQLPWSRSVPPADIAPDPVTAIRRPGIVPRRLLMFGGGVLAGVGLRNHNDGLPGAVADELLRRSRRGVDITVVVERDPLGKRALEGLQGLRLRRFDGVIVVLDQGEPRFGVAPGRRDQNLERLAGLLDADCAETAPAFIYDSSDAPSSSPGSSDGPSSATHGKAAGGEEPEGFSRVRFRELPPQPAVLGSTAPFSSVTYEGWADLIVTRLDLETAELRATLGARPAPSLTYQKDDETMRQRALRGLRFNADADTSALEFLVREARAAFGTAGAALVVVNGDDAWGAPCVGLVVPTVSRDKAFTNIAIQSDRPTIISDTHRDPRTTRSAVGTGGPDIRFYAAYPIHTWDGYRIGALCIYDTAPRDVSVADLAKLWDLAGQIELKIWSASLRDRPLSRAGSVLQLAALAKSSLDTSSRRARLQTVLAMDPPNRPAKAWGGLRARWR